MLRPLLAALLVEATDEDGELLDVADADELDEDGRTGRTKPQGVMSVLAVHSSTSAGAVSATPSTRTGITAVIRLSGVAEVAQLPGRRAKAALPLVVGAEHAGRCVGRGETLMAEKGISADHSSMGSRRLTVQLVH